ncbi:MAG: hypothetical protein K9H64_20810 [Bacteroidales bacterium]|nr:hypothetical protein [Bacteroidales bacterium]MCF8458451.1 hypothetical protein [Bacteroidales bacterium]
MLQYIITYIIIAGAVAYSTYQAFLFFKPSKGKQGGGCAGCSGGCGLKSEIRINLQQKENFNFMKIDGIVK